MAYYNQGYSYQSPYQMNSLYGGGGYGGGGYGGGGYGGGGYGGGGYGGGGQFSQVQQDWGLIQIPGAIRPYYIHTPTCYVYETPLVTGMPLGLYSMQSGVLNLYSQQNQNQYYGGMGNGYRSMPVETPYSATALALQGGRYPATTMAVTNEMAYPSYGSPYSTYGTYGQRGMLPGLIM